MLGRPAITRAGIPFTLNRDEGDTAGRGNEETLSLLRRWSLAGGLSGDIPFPRELSEVQERERLAATTDSEAPHSARPLIDTKERETLRDGKTGRQRGSTIGAGPPSSSRPNLFSRTTISFEQPLTSPRREIKKSTTSSVTSTSAPARSPMLVHGRRSFVASPDGLSGAHPSQRNHNALRIHSLVQPHPPTKPWDDAPRHDIPYKNPAYGSKIDGFLLLPRNPLGRLDLDESVELRRAITTEPGGGGLGEWVDETPLVSNEAAINGSESIIAAPGTLPIPGAHSTAESREGLRRRGSMFSAMSGFTHPTLPGSPGRYFTGTEEVVLPPGIKARVTHDEYGFKIKRLGRRVARGRRDDSDSDMENTGEPWQGDGGYFTVKRKASQGRPGLREALQRGKSSHSQIPAAISDRIGHSLSILSQARSMSNHHASTPLLDVEPALLPDLHAQSPFVDPDVGIQVVVTHSSLGSSPAIHNTGLSAPIIDGLPTTTGAAEDIALVLRPSAPIRSPVLPLLSPAPGSSRSRRSSQERVTFHEAVVGEVLAEEQVATTKRVKSELEEAERAVVAARSLWFGWMWKHVPTGAAATPKMDGTHETPRATDMV